MATTTTDERVNWEVVWGSDEHDRVLYVDYGDGAFHSETAEIRAVRKFLEISKYRARVGLYKNGVLDAGEDVAA